jgi:hypothetical protein
MQPGGPSDVGEVTARESLGELWLCATNRLYLSSGMGEFSRQLNDLTA